MAKSGQRTTTQPGYRRILWPTDFSVLARVAFPYALKLAADAAAELVIFHALTPAESDVLPGITGRIWGRLERESRIRGEGQLRLLTDEAERRGVRARTALAAGVPFQEILRAARRLRCDLIVIATHGRTGLRNVLIGSVAEKVVRRAPCPVLTVRPPGIAPRD